MSGTRLGLAIAIGLVVACGDDAVMAPAGGAGAGAGGASGSVAVSASGSGGAAGSRAGAGAAGAAGSGAGAGSGGVSGSSAGSGGVSGSGSAAGSGGSAGGAAGSGGSGGGSAGSGGSSAPMITGNFSFFVTSLVAIRRESGDSMGYGGDLGGLEGADAICQKIAAFEGAGHKTWRAFLSATEGGPNGGPVHAIDRIGEGPWYDRKGRLVAMNKAGLMMQRPAGDAVVAANLPDEKGEPLNQNDADDHDVLTGSNMQGRLMNDDPGSTCNDWTSAVGSIGRPMCGHGWPARSGMHWIQSHPAGGCAKGINLVQSGGPMGSNTVGGGGGYGGFYCFALQP